MKKSSLTVRPANPDDYKRWNTAVYHPLQTWEWGEFRQKMGIDVVRLIVEEEEKKSQCWQLTFHKIPHTPFTIGYFPKGPMPDKCMLNELTKLGKQKKAIFIQLEPNITNNFQFSIFNFQLKKSHHPLFTTYTFVLDLTQSEEELLKNMHSKTRYNIRLAQKHGVVVKEDSSDGAFQSYLALSEETTHRQGFFAHNQTYHQTMWDTMRINGTARLFTATYNHEIITVWIIFCFQDTMYYPYGASSRKYREVMAPNLMLWELIRWGKAKGLKQFDLWGAMGPSTDGSADGLDTNDPWYGFHRFKEGYSPDLVEFVIYLKIEN